MLKKIVAEIFPYSMVKISSLSSATFYLLCLNNNAKFYSAHVTKYSARNITKREGNHRNVIRKQLYVLYNNKHSIFIAKVFLSHFLKEIIPFL